MANREERLLHRRPRSAFDVDGAVVANPRTAADEPLAIASDGAAVFAAGFQKSSVGESIRIEKGIALTADAPPFQDSLCGDCLARDKSIATAKEW